MTNSFSLTKNKARFIFLFISLAALAYFAPFFKQQFVTGTLVNASLFLTVSLLGIKAGIIIAMIPSLLALFAGTLPTPLAPMVPFIMLGNVLLVVIFKNLEKKYFLAVITASLSKFIFLFLSSSFIFNLILKKELAQNIITMMSWPQLITALSGGILSCLLLRFFIKK